MQSGSQLYKNKVYKKVVSSENTIVRQQPSLIAFDPYSLLQRDAEFIAKLGKKGHHN